MPTPEERAILQRLLKDSKLTYKRLAEVTGLGPMHAWRIVNADVECEVDTLRQLVEGMGSTLGEFFTELEQGVSDRSKPHGRKDLSQAVAKADNAELDGPDLQNAVDRLASEGLLAGAAEVIVEAIDRNSTALGAIRAELQQFRTDTAERLERLATSAEQARKSRRR